MHSLPTHRQYLDEWGYMLVGLAAALPCFLLPLVLPNKVCNQHVAPLHHHNGGPASHYDTTDKSCTRGHLPFSMHPALCFGTQQHHVQFRRCPWDMTRSKQNLLGWSRVCIQGASRWFFRLCRCGRLRLHACSVTSTMLAASLFLACNGINPCSAGVHGGH